MHKQKGPNEKHSTGNHLAQTPKRKRLSGNYQSGSAYFCAMSDVRRQAANPKIHMRNNNELHCVVLIFYTDSLAMVAGTFTQHPTRTHINSVFNKNVCRGSSNSSDGDGDGDGNSTKSTAKRKSEWNVFVLCIFRKDKWPSIYLDESWCSLFVNAESWCLCVQLKTMGRKYTFFLFTQTHTHLHTHTPFVRAGRRQRSPLSDHGRCGHCEWWRAVVFHFVAFYPIVFNKINNGSMWWTTGHLNAYVVSGRKKTGYSFV